ncbi:MAG: hypothetical protein AMS22_15480 [Thiotrichales bacterium SG8_50]|nr:MAG: hypothetical protein AMS22_15480 [Thiotrichales bacterium SG8_50]
MTLAVLTVLQNTVTIGFNVSPSLPGHVYLVLKTGEVHKGELVGFYWHGNYPYAKGSSFVKYAAGTEGDRVSRDGRNYSINGKQMGRAKELSLTGEPLEMGPTGVIPANKIYVMAPHKDSLDSRYALTGWIDKKQVIGPAYEIF